MYDLILSLEVVGYCIIFTLSWLFLGYIMDKYLDLDNIHKTNNIEDGMSTLMSGLC